MKHAYAQQQLAHPTRECARVSAQWQGIARDTASGDSAARNNGDNEKANECSHSRAITEAAARSSNDVGRHCMATSVARSDSAAAAHGPKPKPRSGPGRGPGPCSMRTKGFYYWRKGVRVARIR
jgi:hypothetical protein